MSSPILNATIAAIQAILGRDLDAITVERAVVGLFFTGVKLTCGSGIAVGGSCATPRDAVPGDVCCPVTARAAGYQRLAGRPAAELMHDAPSANGLRRAVGIATLNALAELAWRRRPCPGVELLPGADAFDATAIGPGERVVLVGAFIPFLKELKRRRQPYPGARTEPGGAEARGDAVLPPGRASSEIVPGADVLLITGATLLNDTLEDLLALARPEARITVVGPTVGMLPDAFVARGASVLGSVRITRPDEFLDLVAEAGSAPHFLGPAPKRSRWSSAAGRGPPLNANPGQLRHGFH